MSSLPRASRRMRSLRAAVVRPAVPPASGKGTSFPGAGTDAVAGGAPSTRALIDVLVASVGRSQRHLRFVTNNSMPSWMRDAERAAQPALPSSRARRTEHPFLVRSPRSLPAVRRAPARQSMSSSRAMSRSVGPATNAIANTRSSDVVAKRTFFPGAIADAVAGGASTRALIDVLVASDVAKRVGPATNTIANTSRSMSLSGTRATQRPRP